MRHSATGMQMRIGGQTSQYGVRMRLLPMPDVSGTPTLWINPDHLVSIQAVYRTAERGVELDVELKLDGMPLMRVRLGAHPDRTAGETAFQEFLAELLGEQYAV